MDDVHEITTQLQPALKLSLRHFWEKTVKLTFDDTEKRRNKCNYFHVVLLLITVSCSSYMKLRRMITKESSIGHMTTPYDCTNFILLVFIGPESDHWLCLSITD